MTTADERAALIEFRERYAVPPSDVTREVERAVIGSDWGANGYTTLEQADRLAEVLELGPGRRLLDVGSGRGWPGLYLAATTGCDVVLTDLPTSGLRLAKARIEEGRLAGAASLVACAASAMPFRGRRFDAVVHTDVLC